MPAEVNAYALSLELSLKDQASEALRGMVNLANQVETQIGNIQQKLNQFSGEAKDVGVQLAKISEDINKLSSQKIEKATEGVKIALDENKQIDEAAKTTTDMLDMRETTEKKLQAAALKFMKKDKEYIKLKEKDMKQETKTGKFSLKELATAWLSKRKIRDVDVDMSTTLGDILGTQQKQVGVLDKIRGIYDKIETKVHGIKQSVAGMFSGIGLGQIAQAATLTGIFGLAVTGAAERAEKFHTVNYRNLGTMEEISDLITDMGNKQLPVTMDELTNATIALREMGAQRQGIEGLRVSTAEFVRTTGAGADETARLNTRLTALSGNTEYATQQMATMIKASKNLNLSGKDVDVVMRNIGDSAFFLGTAGSNMMGQYQRSLLGIAASAKKLGVDVGDATQKAESLQDPFKIAALVGQEAIGMNIDQLREASAQQASNYLQQIEHYQKLGDAASAALVKREALMRLEQAGLGNTIKDLQVVAGMAGKTSEDVAKAFEETGKKPEEQIEEATKTAAGQMRNRELIVDRFVAKMQEQLRPVQKAFDEFFKFLASSPLVPTLLMWGAVIVAVGGLFIGAVVGMISMGVSLLGMLVNIGIGFGSALISVGRFAFSAGQAAVGLAGGLLPALTLLGQAALVAGAAFAGWKLGQWTDQTLGLSESVDKCVRGTASWTDWIKQLINPMGAVAVLYGKWIKSAHDHNTEMERAAQLATREKLAQQGLLMPLTSIDYKIAELKKKKDAMAKGAIGDRRKVEAEIQALYDQQGAIQATKDHMDKMAEAGGASTIAGKTLADQVKETTQATEGLSQATKENAKIQEAAKGVTVASTEATNEGVQAISEQQSEVEAMLAKVIKGAAGLAKSGLSKIDELIDVKAIKEKLGSIDLSSILKNLTATMGKEFGPVADQLKEMLGAATEGVAAGAEEQLKDTAESTKASIDQSVAGADKLQAAALVGSKALEMNNDQLKNAAAQQASNYMQQIDHYQKLGDAASEAAVKREALTKLEQAGLGNTMADLQTVADMTAKPEAVEPVVASKITGEIGPNDDEDRRMMGEQSSALAAISSTLMSIKGQMSPEAAQQIAEVLQRFLPEIAQGRDSGLASTANQWQPT